MMAFLLNPLLKVTPFFLFINCTYAEIIPDTEERLIALQSQQLKIFGRLVEGVIITQYGFRYDSEESENGDLIYRRNQPEFEETHRLRFNTEGLLKLNDNVLDSTLANGYQLIYIMDNDGAIYAENIPLVSLEGVFHSSLVGHEWPIAAGTLEVDHGRLVTITNQSGHYAPSPDTLNLVVKSLAKTENSGHSISELVILPKINMI